MCPNYLQLGLVHYPLMSLRIHSEEIISESP
jgi:hypothetical protein